MSEKRKDSKGRVLKDGESQRANGTTDNRHCKYILTEIRIDI